ncbi:MAG: hypothetical protein RIB63_00325, partial [Fulvivirga sp.]
MKSLKCHVFTLVFIIGALFSQSSFAQDGEVNWLSFEEAVEKSKTEKRKIFIHHFTPPTPVGIY